MVKRGPLKLIYSEHKPLLFDLSRDPQELTDVAKQDEYKDVLAELLALAQARWPDLAALTERILKSQRNRRMIHAAMLRGKRSVWDHQPSEDVSRSYIRN